MTAIAGLWQFRGNGLASLSCAGMLTNLQMYGGDDQRLWSEDEIALGCCLKRTLPEDAYDTQPLISAQTGAIIVADVRIDNREEICQALRLAPQKAAQLCDAAVLLATYDQWGLSCLDRLVGDFAFAIWDPRIKQLLLGRDPVGQRPLHYHTSAAFFAFASMTKGLHALAEIPCAPNKGSAAEFLALLPVANQSFYQDIERLPSGHVAVITRADGVCLRRYWKPNPQPLRLKRPEDYVEGYRFHLDQAVRSCLRGATNVAAQLSAGFDSSAVAATAARLLAPQNGQVIAYTAVPRQGYDGGAALRGFTFDEGPIAAETAAMYGNMEHELVRTGETSPIARLDENLALFEQPLLNICNQSWIDEISKRAQSRGLKVLLTGQLGNESISYAGTELFSELLVRGRIFKWVQEARVAITKGYVSPKGVLAATFGPFFPERLWEMVLNRKGVTIDIMERCALRPEFADRVKARIIKDKFNLFSRPETNGFALRYETLCSVDNGNLHAGTLAGWGLDRRDPTADRRLIEFCLAVPTEQFFFQGTPKSLARRALSDRLPLAVLEARQKARQYVDWHEAINADRKNIAQEVLRLEQSPAARSTVDVARLRQLVDNWPSEGWDQFDIWLSYRAVLLRAISVGHFLRRTSPA